MPVGSFWYTKNVKNTLDRINYALDFDSDTTTMKMALSNVLHVPAKTTDEKVDDAGTDDLADGEGGITGYTGGFGGAGRKVLVATTVAISGVNVQFDANDLTWTAITSATNLLGQATLVKEITNDVSSPVLINLGFANVNPGGNDLTVQFAATGIGYAST